jgi:hypothetical protein
MVFHGLNGKDRKMDLELSEFQRIVRERKEITASALECAGFVFECARELSPHQQRPMIELVKRLISVKEKMRTCEDPFP